MTIVGTSPDAVIGGVDTHADTHVAAVINHVGGVVGVESFTTTQAGYRRSMQWPQPERRYRVRRQGCRRPATATSKRSEC